MRERFELRGDSQPTVSQALTVGREPFDASGTPADQDLLLNISVVVGRYSATDQAWVMADDWREFLTDLRTLEQMRTGQATLRSASPQDLELNSPRGELVTGTRVVPRTVARDSCHISSQPSRFVLDRFPKATSLRLHSTAASPLRRHTIAQAASI